MKHRLKTALLVVALLGIAAQTPLSAAPVKKAEQQTVKKGPVKAAAKAPSSAKSATSKSTSRSAATKQPSRKVAAKAPSGKSASAGAVKKTSIAHESSRKLVRHAVLTDIDPGRLALYSASALVIDQSNGQVMLEKHPDMVVPIASISKLMTAMVVLDAKLDLQELIAIGDEDVDGLKGTRSRLPVGTTMTREAAMLLALMSSENRAAHALGRHYPGGMHAFVQAMNKKAHALGMYHSRFDEPTGLSSNNVSTAHDLARMGAGAHRHLGNRCFEDRLYFGSGSLPGHAGAGCRQAGGHCAARFARQDDAGRRCKPDQALDGKCRSGGGASSGLMA